MESVLTTSPPSASARSSASSDLPTAVVPTTATTGSGTAGPGTPPGSQGARFGPVTRFAGVPAADPPLVCGGGGDPRAPPQQRRPDLSVRPDPWGDPAAGP